MKWLCISIGFILVGLGIGYAGAIKSIAIWSKFYYLWDKVKDLFLVITLSKFLVNRALKSALKYLASFFVLRIIWDLIAITTDYHTAASPEIMMAMFILWAALIIRLMILGIKEEWQLY